ncbi:hypothetical protein [Nodosilinea sp. P-1105]|nr:hypothetical protein [Nodosilinea sp. P-1105]
MVDGVTLQAGHYTTVQSFQTGAIAPLAFPNIDVAVEELLIQAQT